LACGVIVDVTFLSATSEHFNSYSGTYSRMARAQNKEAATKVRKTTATATQDVVIAFMSRPVLSREAEMLASQGTRLNETSPKDSERGPQYYVCGISIERLEDWNQEL
jgi:hypothetical protein